MLKKIKLQEAVGNRLEHDITEIRPGEFKGPAFRKGHTVCDEDLCHLQRLGKNHLYVIDLENDEIHENEAAAILAGALAGDGVVWKDDPKEGKIELLADRDGLLVVNSTSLAAFNMEEEVMCATLHSYTLVGKGDRVAGYLPNSIHSLVAMLATASLGAVWSSSSPDFGPIVRFSPFNSE